MPNSSAALHLATTPSDDTAATAASLASAVGAGERTVASVDLTALLRGLAEGTEQDEEAALTAIIDEVDRHRDTHDVVVTSAALAPALSVGAFALHCRIATEIAAGLVLADPETDSAFARREAARHGAVVVGQRQRGGGWGSAAAGEQHSSLGDSATYAVTEHDSLADVAAHLTPHTRLQIAGCRLDLLLGLAVGIRAGTFAAPAGLVLTRPVDGQTIGLATGISPSTTIIDAPHPPTPCADLIAAARKVTANPALTPLRFQHGLLLRARANPRHVVLPEGEEPRILQAADQISRLGAARLTLLGEPDLVRERAGELGVDLDGIDVVNPRTDPRREHFAEEYARIRSAKGVSLAAARQKMDDVSYFGTMMVHLGDADAMVSGAVHTTAHTIKPAFEIIKTRPGVGVVSSVFFMCLSDRVLVFGDCAVNPNPTPAQLADIAISSADTASAFGISPRVAMLSYSTGTSGQGPDVDAVVEATALAHERAPSLTVDGPLQLDAALDPGVAASKAPGSSVAGRATVLVFQDLTAGNATYKAVQRTAGALAIGPVLQGLNKPVNDLSRGATVADIVNTVLVSAVQAGELASR